MYAIQIVFNSYMSLNHFNVWFSLQLFSTDLKINNNISFNSKYRWFMIYKILFVFYCKKVWIKISPFKWKKASGKNRQPLNSTRQFVWRYEKAKLKRRKEMKWKCATEMVWIPLKVKKKIFTSCCKSASRRNLFQHSSRKITHKRFV